MFAKIFSVLQRFVSVDIKLISVVVLVLMSTSVDCQSNQSICKFIIKEGRVRDLRLYQFIDWERSYRLFSREWNGVKDQNGSDSSAHNSCAHN